MLTSFPLLEYQAYLTQLGLSGSTGLLYASNIRHVLRLAFGKMPTAELLAKVLQEPGAGRRTAFKAAWNSYRVFLKAKGYDAPALPEGTRAARVKAEWLPPHARAALFTMLADMPEPLTPKELHELTYQRIEQTRDGIVFTVKSSPRAGKSKYKFIPTKSREGIKAFFDLQAWAYPNVRDTINERAPFLPYGPEIEAPAPLSALRKLLGVQPPRQADQPLPAYEDMVRQPSAVTEEDEEPQYSSVPLFERAMPPSPKR